MPKRRATKREQAHLQRIRALPCVLCDMLGQAQQFPTSVHHIRTGQGMSERASHYLTIPLCNDPQRRGGCHQGDEGVHGDRTLLRIAKLDELDLLAATIERLS